jgi:putative membrane-bound dehydrogenase-like protein
MNVWTLVARAPLRRATSRTPSSSFLPMPRLLSILFCCWLCASTGVHGQVTSSVGEDLGVRVPEGFEVELYADDTLAHDIYSMTFDAQGRVVIAGAGYVKILHDTDGDGRADKATLYSELPKSGAHGMYFDGPDLICTGDNCVLRLRDRDGDGAADGPPEVWTHLRNPEHGANGIVRGPDGCYYLVCGNDAGISTEHAAAAASPVKQPRSGGIVRFSPEGKVLDVFAHGFRNPYDLDIDAQGHVLTVDSDGERDHHLPWYAPTRLFDVAQGQEHGWLLKGWTQSWNRPESFFDNVERAAEIGRGSPTGVAVYRHRQFPEHYRGGVFAACWTFGRVYYFPLHASGASCTAPCETFMETTGDVGFAPCDLAVGPQGDLFVAIGGRRTRGSVFRVSYRGDKPEPIAGKSLDRVLAADQPLSSWSRAAWVPAARELGADVFAVAARDERLPSEGRIRAIEVLVEVFGGLDFPTATAVRNSTDAATRARAAWAIGRSPFSAETAQVAVQLTDDEDAVVQRAAWEAIATLPELNSGWEARPAWARGLNHPLRRVRAAAIAVARGVGADSYQAFTERVRIGADATRLRLAQLWIGLPDSPDSKSLRLDSAQFAQCAAVVADEKAETAVRLEAVRLAQIGLGDVRLPDGGAEVYGGYAGNASAALAPPDRESLVSRLAPSFPSGDDELDRELARLLGMLPAEHDALLPALARKWTATSSVEDDVHYLIVASLLPGARSKEFTTATANCLSGLHPKLAAAQQFASRNWPFRVSETFTELARRDPLLPVVLAACPRLTDVGHAMFVEHLPKELQSDATRTLWAAVLESGQEPTGEMVALAARLPAEEAASLLRPQWDLGGLRDAVVLVLAKNPQPNDREKFVDALASPQPEVVERSARALMALGIRSTPAEMAAALRALKQACSLGKQLEPRTALMRLLEFWTEDGADVEWDPDPANLWVGWYQLFAGYYPAEYARLKASSGADVASWKNRLEAVDWDAGDVNAGRHVFEHRSCHRCHQVSGHLGPELKGAVSRMSREDLFTAIVDPNLEVSPTYLTTLLATSSGQVYHGLVVYESPEGTLLQTGPDTTVRITNTETESMRPSSQSLMPTGLLDPLSDQQLSDLYAYLKSLATD